MDKHLPCARLDRLQRGSLDGTFPAFQPGPDRVGAGERMMQDREDVGFAQSALAHYDDGTGLPFADSLKSLEYVQGWVRNLQELRCRNLNGPALGLIRQADDRALETSTF